MLNGKINRKQYNRDLDERDTVNVKEIRFVNPKEVREGRTVYDEATGTFYVKVNGRLLPINSGNKKVVNETTNIVSLNSYNIHISNIVELYNKGWIQMVEQVGNISDNLKTPVCFNEIVEVVYHLLVTSVDSGAKQKIADKFAVYKKVVPVYSTGDYSDMQSIACLDYAVKFGVDKRFKLRLREIRESKTNPDKIFVLRESEYTGSKTLTSGIYTEYEDGFLLVKTEFVINVSI